MRTVQFFLIVFVGLFLLGGCSDENKKTTPPENLEFHKSLIGLWESDIKVKDDNPSDRSSDMEVPTFSGHKSYVRMLFNTNTVTINEYRDCYRENEKISGGYKTQKCELIEVDAPYYTLLVSEGETMGKRMVFKYIPEKELVEWEVYISLGFIQEPKNFKKID